MDKEEVREFLLELFPTVVSESMGRFKSGDYDDTFEEGLKVSVATFSAILEHALPEKLSE